MDRNQILASISEEITKLERVRELLSTTNGHGLLNGSGNGHGLTKKRVLSQEARDRIADAQKRRWAKQRKETASAKK